MLNRRRLLLTLVVTGAAAAACRQVAAPPATPTDPPSPTVDDWRAQAHAMVNDALATLRTFDDFVAYRVSITPSSGLRSQASLAWDPPSGADWDFATHTSRGLHDRAFQLFQAITTASIDSTLWRTQRTMADATQDIITLGDALRAYRDRIDRMPPGDTSGALGLLDAAWKQWDMVAGSWDITRAEPVACQA